MPFRSLNQWKLTSLNEGIRRLIVVYPSFIQRRIRKTSDAIPLLKPSLCQIEDIGKVECPGLNEGKFRLTVVYPFSLQH